MSLMPTLALIAPAVAGVALALFLQLLPPRVQSAASRVILYLGLVTVLAVSFALGQRSDGWSILNIPYYGSGLATFMFTRFTLERRRTASLAPRPGS